MEGVSSSFNAKAAAGVVIVPMGGKLTVSVTSTDVAVVLEQLVQKQSASSSA
jgi:hypothetical protein